MPIILLRHHLLTRCLTVLLVTLYFAGCNRSNPISTDEEVVTVTVAKPVTKQIVEWDAYTGRIEAIDFVEVRSRVSGYLQSSYFEEGQVVHEGDLLFIVDPRPFEAELNRANATLNQMVSQLQQAKAQLEQAKATQKQSQAQLQLAESRVERTRQLATQNAASTDELDQREAEFLQAKADIESSKAGISLAQAAIVTAQAGVEAAKAGVEAAELNLEYTRIRAPVTGRTSDRIVTTGNLISGGTATSTLLTTITSEDPIYCTFDANEQQVLKYTRLARAGKRESSRVAKNPVYLGLIDEEGFPHQGHMDFVDNRFDLNTATMRARCIFPNKNQILVPGMFARIRIPGSAAYEAVLIPDSSIGTDQSQQYVYIVVDNVIQRRGVKTGPIVDGLRVIREGLTGEESLVIEGLLQSRPDLEVQAQPGTIEVIEDGLPHSYEPLPPDKWISSGSQSVPPKTDESKEPNQEKGEKK